MHIKFFTRKSVAIKNSNFKYFTTGILGFTSLFLTTSLSADIPRATTSIIKDNPKEVIDQVWQIVYRNYLDHSGNFDTSKWISIRNDVLSRSYPDKASSYEAINLMLSNLDDPYTRFLNPKEFKEMRIDTSGKLTGIGIQLSLNAVTKDLIVISPIEGTPAFRAGVKSQDIIISIDGRSTKGMSIEEAVRLIRGRKGTNVVIGIKRNNKQYEFPLVRDMISINAVDSQLNKLSTGINVGYIRLKQFNANAAKEMRLTINKLEKSKASGYVLDLRSNPGGLLEASVQIARQWLNEGVIVSTLTRDGIRDIRKAKGKALTDRPLIVLVNEGSASASEILSGAIKDNRRGVLVGKRTFGKGLVQSVRALSDGSGLTVTIARYLTPNGLDIHNNGIKPDLIVDSLEDKSKPLSRDDLGTIKDNQYKVAETTLIKLINQKNTNTFNSNSTNLKSVLPLSVR